VLFALVLEQLAYALLMKFPVWSAITGSVWIFGLVGGFFAGLFEETGRFVAFKTVLRKKRGNDANALMYGAGHGCVEAVILLSVTMFVNIVYALQFNAGIANAEYALRGAGTDEHARVDVPRRRVWSASPRVALHVSLSVLVWFAAKNGKRFWLYPLAILLHLVVDAGRGHPLAPRRQRLGDRGRGLCHGGGARCARRRGVAAKP
jgi:uncharacterized membrane protein YhfC